MTARVAGHFIPGGRGNLLVVTHLPANSIRGSILLVPPMAEEMNKSRRMMALLGASLADAGFAAVLPDLYGTGDSEGEFVEATWTTWMADLESVIEWARRSIAPIHGAVAIRLGCALLQAIADSGSAEQLRKTVFWQPAFDGKQWITQFLRLRTAASMMTDQRETITQLVGEFERNQSIEVAGYEISAVLYRELLAAVEPEGLSAGLGDVLWLNCRRRDASTETPTMVVPLIERSQQSGVRVIYGEGDAEPFWSSVETVINKPMVERTCEFLCGVEDIA